ncbi:MAG: mechanosensitive ion channel [Hyphomonadaceae bacterium]|nr:mechanosensitive ion channel [Hyphomonadaceae bacterium]
MTPTAPVSLDAIIRQLESAIAGALMLNPEQAALRAGISFLIVGGAAILMTIIRLALRAVVSRVTPEDEQQSKKRDASRKVGGLALALVRLAIVVGAIYFLLRVWGLDFGLFTGGAVGAALAGIGRALLIIIIAIAAVEVSGFAILRSLHRVARSARDPRRAAQVRTLAPVLRGAVQTIIVVLAAMMFLSQLGVEVGPLVAGAGIVGLAVGFGAQTIVKDFLTGIFLIVEDIVSIGDVVQIGEFGGVVEEMSLRTIRLRDFDGTLHIFPYSEAQVIHNRTKTFSYAVFDLSVDYSADIPRAIEVMKETGAELRADSEFAPLLLDSIEVVGVDKLADSAVVLKARIKTLPGKQWTVKREYLKRVKAAFDAAGVIIPFPTLKLIPADGPVREEG